MNRNILIDKISFIKDINNMIQKELETFEFVCNTNSKIDIIFIKNHYFFIDDEEHNITRNIYKVTIKRNAKQFTYMYASQSNNFEIPTFYEVLSRFAFLDNTSYNSFCTKFKLDKTIKESIKTYKKAKKHMRRLNELYDKDEILFIKYISDY